MLRQAQHEDFMDTILTLSLSKGETADLTAFF
jgi:hypothetical protein